MWRRNSPWYSLKFSSTATPPSLCSSIPPALFLSFLHLFQQPSSRLVACLHASLDCPWSFWWIHKTSCILDWDGAVEKTRVMERRKAISTSWEQGKRRLWGEVERWMCLGVMGCRDNKRKRRKDEGSSYGLCNINLWCRDKRQVSTGFSLVESECRACYWTSCHFWTNTKLFQTCICLLHWNLSRGRAHTKGLQLLTESTWWRDTILNSLESF